MPSSSLLNARQLIGAKQLWECHTEHYPVLSHLKTKQLSTNVGIDVWGVEEHCLIFLPYYTHSMKLLARNEPFVDDFLPNLILNSHEISLCKGQAIIVSHFLSHSHFHIPTIISFLQEQLLPREEVFIQSNNQGPIFLKKIFLNIHQYNYMNSEASG